LNGGIVIENVNDLLSREIAWVQNPDRPGWQAIVDDEGCSLTMNDFPAEPLYTVRWRDQQLDFDDSPQCWSIPFGENEFRAT